MNSFHTTGTGTVQIGKSTSIGEGAQIVFARPGVVKIGDYCTIGPGVKIVCAGGDVTIGDWTTLHDNCLVMSGQHAVIGEHCWFGQNCVIDGTGGLRIGQGVRVGMYSQIWSHVAAGEQIEGCTLFGEREVVIEDDVWLVGSCVVSSGVTIGRRTVALTGSNITKSFAANSTIAGMPAAMKPSLSFYKDITLEEKWVLITDWMQSAAEDLRTGVESAAPDLLVISAGLDEGTVMFALTADTASVTRRNQPEATVCCIEDKTYNKRYSPLEKRVLKFLAGNKARFYAA